jgi:NAD+ synthetase
LPVTRQLANFIAMPLLHLAIAQFRPRKGDVQGNLRRVGEVLAQAVALEPRPHVVQFPETALSGYFVEGGVREMALTAEEFAAGIAAAYRGPPIDAIVGFYEKLDGDLHNSLAYVRCGAGAEILHIHRKTFLPTYGLFDEERFVERGYSVRAFDAPWGRAAMLICEDAWHSLTGLIAALDGAHLIFVSSASPARGGFDRADEHGVFVTLSSLVGSEGGRMFQGGSLVVGPRGDTRARAPVFEESLLTASIDLDDITKARADLPLLSDMRTLLPKLKSELERSLSEVGPKTEDRRPKTVDSGLPSSGPKTNPSALSVVAGGDLSRGSPPPLDIDPALVESWLVAFLKDEFARRGFEKAVVGLSGGVDSAVVATLAARALGPENVVAIRMPYKTSSPDSLAHAQKVIDTLGVESRTLDISAAVDGYLALEPDANAARRGNVMARMRMIALFDLSAKHHALPLGTGNKSERLLGYFTWHADDSPPVNPIGDLFKTQLWALARHLGVPLEIIEKPASADLMSGQTDEGDFGISYAKADVILNWLLNGYTPAELTGRGFDGAEVEIVRKRLDGTHWKRKLPTVAMLSGAAIGESYLRPVDF